MGRGSQSWRSRVGLVGAALASLATSQPTWLLSGSVTPTVVPEQKAFRYTITASTQPNLETSGVPGDAPMPVPASPSTWTGTQTLDLFAGSKLERVTLGASCDDGGGCSDCDPPPGAFVNVAGPEILDVWTKSVEADVTFGETYEGTNCLSGEGGAISVDISGSPTTNLTFRLTSPDVPAEDVGPLSVTSFGSSFTVHFGAAAFRTTNWKVTAIVRGVCTSGGPCEAPASDVKIDNASATRCKVTKK